MVGLENSRTINFPPGFKQYNIEFNAFSLSVTFLNPKAIEITSKLSCLNGISCASSWTAKKLLIFESISLFLPVTSIFSLISERIANPSWFRRGAIKLIISPVPPARSKKQESGLISDISAATLFQIL